MKNKLGYNFQIYLADLEYKIVKTAYLYISILFATVLERQTINQLSIKQTINTEFNINIIFTVLLTE